MIEENGNGIVMPVQPMAGYGYGNGGFGNGFFGGDAWIILFLFAILGGWGNGFGGGFGGGNLGYDFPWLINGQQGINANTNAGFNQAATASALGDIQLGLAGINQNICSTGNNIVSAVGSAQNAIAQQLYGNEIASLNRSYAEQTANSQGFNALQGQLAQCLKKVINMVKETFSFSNEAVGTLAA